MKTYSIFNNKYYTMKQLVIFLSAFLFIISCKKEHTVIKEKIETRDTTERITYYFEPIECIERIYTYDGEYDSRTIDDIKLNKIKTLLQTNNIDFNSYNYYFNFQERNVENGNSLKLQTTIYCKQYSNGLPVFLYDLEHVFYNSQYSFTQYKLSQSISLDTIPNLKLDSLKVQYNAKLASDVEYLTFVNYFHPNLSCIAAEFAYYDLNRLTSIGTPNFVKAWKIYPKYTSYIYAYPILYINDADGSVILYWNGIMT